MKKITIVGVGALDGELTDRAKEALKSAEKRILSTMRCPAANWLKRENLEYASLDNLYDAANDFESLQREAADTVLEAASTASVAYAVLDVRDMSVMHILQSAPCEVIPGPPAENNLFSRAQGQTLMFSASDWASAALHARQGALIRELDSRELAAEIKLRLMECYGDDHIALVLQPDGGIARTPLYNLDRLPAYDHRSGVFVPAVDDVTALTRFSVEDLYSIVQRLAAPDGCPWDSDQTAETLKTCILEEAYEVIDATDRGNEADLIEELGDLLFVLLLEAAVAERHGEFDLRDIATEAAEKMIRRHPHVFGNAEAPQDVNASWRAVKQQEKGDASHTSSMRAVARALPALTRARKVLERMEDPARLRAIADCPPDAPIGKRLLSLVAEAMNSGKDPEDALTRATEELIDSFEA